MNIQLPGENSQPEVGQQFMNDLEAAGLYLGIVLLIRRIRKRHHGRAASVMVIFGTLAFAVMMTMNMATNAALLFWALAFVSFCALCKCLS